MRALVIVPGFGAPYAQEKSAILLANLRLLSTPDVQLEVHVFAYDDSQVDALPPRENITVTVHREPGVIGDFMRRHVTPPMVAAGAYDDIIVMLDDVRLDAPYPWQLARKVMQDLSLDILSPSLARRDMTHWEFMVTQPQCAGMIAMSNACEFFFYHFTPHGYAKYYQYLYEDNPWMWGIDFAFPEMNIRVARMNDLTISHFFKGAGGNNAKRSDDGTRFLARRGLTWQSVLARPPIYAMATLDKSIL